ncbi:angiopoietin-related protein 6-like [Musca autumnalis]|uniref:angiopoietin-related protein 6-like n=1 Tax=Musca autumnalis TaxID=221902 RepID=UPI003CE91403
MGLYFLFTLLIYVAISESNNSTVDYNGISLQNEDENMILLWKTLFTKIDNLSKDNDKLRATIERLEDKVNSLEKCKTHPWTTVLRRQDGSVNFYRNWEEYKVGFGNPPEGEFFIGLENLYRLTKNSTQELMIVLKDWNNEMRYAFYDYFKIGSEKEYYGLKLLGPYSGDAGDALRIHHGKNFSTFDQWNDTIENCAIRWKGAWWYGACYESHLTGPYRPSADFIQPGVGWLKWKSDYSLKYAEMKIRLKAV